MLPRLAVRPHVVTTVVCCAVSAVASAGQAEAKRHYTVPRGDAATTLGQFAGASGRQIVFMMDKVRGEQTNAIDGEFAPREALDRMLAGTALVAVQDAATGAFVIKRISPPAPVRDDGPTPSPEANPKNMKRKNPLAMIAGWLALTLTPSYAADATTPKPEPKEELVVLSPFEVTADNVRGYYSPNTTSGTRLNSKVEDLAASISVVTKEQMQDFAMLDLNDIFNYEANTEGTSTFTDYSFNANGQPTDNVQLEPQSANRIRGIGNANVTSGNFETSGLTPVDTSMVDAVEISRGPNSNIFGIGSPAGTANMVPAAANLSRNMSRVEARADNFDGWRTSLDVSRVLKKNVLAVRGSMVSEHKGFQLKPSGTDVRLLNGMVKFRPFETTTLSAAYNYYKEHGNRPNATSPRDGLTAWIAGGRPSWDPPTATLKINGAPAATFGATATPVNFDAAGAANWGYVDREGLVFVGAGRGSDTASPATANFTSQGQTLYRIYNVKPDPTGVLAAQPLLQDFPALTNKALYDWSRINIASPNRFEDESNKITVLLDQTFLHSARQNLTGQIGWFRELTDKYQRNIIGTTSSAQTFASSVMIDVNERNLDGSPNPFFLRPYIQTVRPQIFNRSDDRDSFRGQLAYRISASREGNWTRWLGDHQVAGYGEYKQIESRRVSFRDAIASNHPWIPSSVVRGNSGAINGGASPILTQRFYVGDNQGNNIDYGPAGYGDIDTTYRWANGATGQGFSTPVRVAQVPSTDGTGGNSNNKTILKSQGAILQSHFLADRLISTFGLRKDQRYTRTGLSPQVTGPTGTELNYELFNRWTTDDWNVGKGKTTTSGVVVRPLRWLSVYYNKSNSFNPASLAYNLHREPLPDPTGEGTDYGVGMNLLDGKLVVRLNHYKTVQINSRNGDSATIAQRAFRLDFEHTTSNLYNLATQARSWAPGELAKRGIANPSEAQITQYMADVMKVPLDWAVTDVPNVSGVDDLKSTGNELEVNYNPTRFFRMRFTLTEKEVINSGVAREVGDWIADRLKVWQTVIDPQSNTPWWDTRYGGNATGAGKPSDFYAGNIKIQLETAQALQGKSRPQIRKYTARFSGSFDLAAISDSRYLKPVTLGSGVRWEDKGGIGYYGVQQLPAIIETLDVNRPIYDKARFYFDPFIRYRTRLLAGKVGASLQLNAFNVLEGGRLQPIYANADGSIAAFRIVDPRKFVLSLSLDL